MRCDKGIVSITCQFKNLLFEFLVRNTFNYRFFSKDELLQENKSKENGTSMFYVLALERISHPVLLLPTEATNLSRVAFEQGCTRIGRQSLYRKLRQKMETHDSNSRESNRRECNQGYFERGNFFANKHVKSPKPLSSSLNKLLVWVNVIHNVD